MDSSSSNSIEVESQQGDAFVTPNQHLSGVKATVQRSADQYYPKRKYRNDPDNKPNQKIIEAISQRSTVSPGQNAIQTTLTEEVTPVDGSIPTTAKGCSKEAFHEDVNGSQPTGSSLSKRHISITLCAFLVFFALSMLFSAVMVVMIATGRLFANDKVDDGFPHYTLDEALL
ncbi:unnamed protein product [Toxocara canis]|uniref:Uncharacterized protein n=1 Tax=Toxocara canis TaxID=6265 RepID=A0A183V9N2_TOXCA|nr:unnamed protein product [Toxocara canis]